MKQPPLWYNNSLWDKTNKICFKIALFFWKVIFHEIFKDFFADILDYCELVFFSAFNEIVFLGEPHSKPIPTIGMSKTWRKQKRYTFSITSVQLTISGWDLVNVKKK